MKITVRTKEKAFEIARTMLDGQCLTQSAERTERAGYPIWETEKNYEWVSDLGDRLEVNQHADSVNIWIDPTNGVAEYQLADALEIISDCIYEIDDKVSGIVKDNTGITEARKLLYGAYAKIRDILDAKFPDSKLYEEYNLKEA